MRIAMRLHPFALSGRFALAAVVAACEAPAPTGFVPEAKRTTETRAPEDPGAGRDGRGGAPPPSDDRPAPTPSPSRDGGTAEGGGAPDGGDGDAPPASCSDPDLIACFPFDGDTKDYSSSRLATSASGVVFGDGHRGSAAELTNGSTITIAGTTALDAAAVTVEAFVRWTDTDADVVVFSAAGRYAMMIESDGSVRCTTPGDSVDGGDVAPNQWMHIACVFDGDAARVFVGGSKEDDGGADIALSPGAGGAIGGSFAGAIDELRVFRGAKTDAEVAGLARR